MTPYVCRRADTCRLWRRYGYTTQQGERAGSQPDRPVELRASNTVGDRERNERYGDKPGNLWRSVTNRRGGGTAPKSLLAQPCHLWAACRVRHTFEPDHSLEVGHSVLPYHGPQAAGGHAQPSSDRQAQSPAPRLLERIRYSYISSLGYSKRAYMDRAQTRGHATWEAVHAPVERQLMTFDQSRVNRHPTTGWFDPLDPQPSRTNAQPAVRTN